MLSTVLLGLHVAVSLLLIALVLMGRGSSAGGLGGGASQTVFGSQGSSPFITKFTRAVVVVWFVINLGLNLYQADNQRSADALVKAASAAEPNINIPKNTPVSQ